MPKEKLLALCLSLQLLGDIIEEYEQTCIN